MSESEDAVIDEPHATFEKLKKIINAQNMDTCLEKFQEAIIKALREANPACPYANAHILMVQKIGLMMLKDYATYPEGMNE